MRITTKGQVTIPQEIRDRFGFLPNTEIDFEVSGNTVRLRKSHGPRRARSELKRLRGSATVKMTTEQILALTRA